MFARSARRIKAASHIPTSSAQLMPRSHIAQQLPRARFSSTQASDGQGSLNHKTFYKTFGRPIAKVFLMAIFTYQLAYYFWVKLEQDEARAEMQAIISDLEARIEQLEQAKPPKK
ncbi:hypothetical protein FHL15_003702 [Xylaria flabelliformis]|uniref:Inner membrane assembly complex subunit 17 n=1 Tax=Xylaria flabelliformis TaxID=2512241 RepID=A0A553I585_9PEZI|nr:hypothetical protein FHL15_003702 [Xylaria flabelliformis]